MPYTNVKFEKDKPETVRFSFDPPFKSAMSKKNEPYTMYGVQWMKNGEWVQASIFTTDFPQLHNLLQFYNVQKGTQAIITKKGGDVWTCEIDSLEYKSDELENVKTVTTKPKSKSQPVPEMTPDKEDLIYTHIKIMRKLIKEFEEELLNGTIGTETVQHMATSTYIEFQKRNLFWQADNPRDAEDNKAISDFPPSENLFESGEQNDFGDN